MQIKINKIDKQALNVKAIIATNKLKNFATKTENKNVFFAINSKKTFDHCLFIRKLSAMLYNLQSKSINFYFDSFLNLVPKNLVKNVGLAIVCKLYSFNLQSFCAKTKKEGKTLSVILTNKYKYLFKIANDIGLATNYAQYAQVAPSNYMGINKFISFVKNKINSVKKIKLSLVSSKDLNKMQLLQAVNKGSDELAQVLILKYFNNLSTKVNIALVGKGIMMDTGGYDLKPSHAMKKMNEDMSNAASVFGSILALAKTNAKVNVIGIIPLAKNLINAKAYKVGDIYCAYNGKTVEINNTDAEGRLILADAISYASKQFKPTTLLSCATLTGLSAICFGDIITPFWTKSFEVAKKLKYAFDISGEYSIELPLLPEYFERVEKSSTLADYGNLFGKDSGNATAAAFLNKFSDCNNFVHLDNAGTNEFKNKSINPFVLILYNFVLSYFSK